MSEARNFEEYRTKVLEILGQESTPPETRNFESWRYKVLTGLSADPDSLGTGIRYYRVYREEILKALGQTYETEDTVDTDRWRAKVLDGLGQTYETEDIVNFERWRLKVLKGLDDYAGGERKTATGTDTLSLTEVIKLLSIIQHGKTVQDGTPTPSAPVDIRCNNGVVRYGAVGKNLAEMSDKTITIGQYINASGVQLNDVNNFVTATYIPVKPNTTYTLTVSDSVYFMSISEYKADKTFVVRNASEVNTQVLTITTGADTHYIRFGSNMDRAKMTLDKVLGRDWMLNEGETLPYEAFVGGIIADGNAEVLKVGGLNIFYNDEAWEEGFFLSSGKLAKAGANRTFLMRCQPNTTYYWKHCSLVGGVRAFSVDEDEIEVGVEGKWLLQNPVVGEVNTVYSATTGADAKWLGVCFGRSQSGATPINDQWSDFILSTIPITEDTPYEPYTEPQNASVQNLFAVGDYEDTQEVISGAVTRRVGVKVLDGTENWIAGSVSGIWISAIWNRAWPGNAMRLISSHYVGTTELNASMPMNSIKITGSSVLQSAGLFIKTNYTDLADFKSFLADQYAQGTPVIVLYPLAEEVTEQTTPQPMDAKGNVNISAISDINGIKLDVEYKGKKGD